MFLIFAIHVLGALSDITVDLAAIINKTTAILNKIMEGE
jgi:hypothetical protein